MCHRTRPGFTSPWQFISAIRSSNHMKCQPQRLTNWLHCVLYVYNIIVTICTRTHRIMASYLTLTIAENLVPVVLELFIYTCLISLFQPVSSTYIVRSLLKEWDVLWGLVLGYAHFAIFAILSRSRWVCSTQSSTLWVLLQWWYIGEGRYFKLQAAPQQYLPKGIV